VYPTVFVLHSVCGDAINVLARRRIGAYLQTALLEGNTLYRLTLDGRVDNFDQRITSDTQEMLNGFMCVIFGNSSDYLAYPLGFTLTRMGFAWYNSLATLPNTYVSQCAFMTVFFRV
jgi:ABC-type uncharacterized transport system fused permease/ATPase subunit